MDSVVESAVTLLVEVAEQLFDLGTRMPKDSYFASLIAGPHTPPLICLPSAALCPQWPLWPLWPLWPPYPTKLRWPLKPQFTYCIIVQPSK